MELVKDTPMEVAWRVWKARPPGSSLTVVVKATFALVPEGICPLAEIQALPTGDLHHDDDIERSLRYPNDLAPLKPRGECMVIGSFHAPHGRAVAQSKIAFQIGSVGKQLAVFGDRVWNRGRATEPAPITNLALSWEHAFGGPGFAENPVGRGIATVDVGGREAVMLPNLEDPSRLIVSRDQRPRPVGVGPVPRTWSARARWAGTYGARWQATRYPWFPEDLDWRYFNAAPAEQQIDGFFHGGEEIALLHLSREHPAIRCRLPGLGAHAFLVTQGSEHLRDVGLALDTLTVDADEGVVYAVWRGVIEVVREDLADIQHLYVAHDSAEAREGHEGFTRRYRGVLDARTAEAIAIEAAPAPTESTIRREAILAAMFDPSAPGARWAHLDQMMTIRGDSAAVQSLLDQAVAARQRENALKPVFEDALGVPDEPPSMERELSPEELLDLEMQLALGSLLDEQVDPRRAEVREAVASGQSLAQRDLAGADLSGLDLVGADLTGAILIGANLSGARVVNTRFDGASLSEAELSLASFESCSFREADMTSVRALRARMHDCDLRDATVAVSYLREARLSSCRLARADLRESDLGDAELRGCALDEADLSGAILTKTCFRESTLVEASIERAQGAGLSMDGCDASGLRASDACDLKDASFKKTVLSGARFGGARLHRANLSLAALGRADFSDALLDEAVLMGCDLRAARFEGASMVGTVLLKSNLMQARLEGASLRRADLRGANLFQAELWQASLDGARLDLADLSGTRRA